MAGWGFGATGAGDVAIDLPMAPGTDSIQCLAWNPAHNLLAAGSWDNKVRIWEVARGPQGQPVGAQGKFETDGATAAVPAAPVLDCAWAADGASLFIAGCNKTLKKWDVAAPGAPVADIGQHDAPIRYVQAVPQLGLIVTAGWDRQLKYWDPRQATGTPALTVALNERIFAMDVRHPGLVATTADKAKPIQIFNLSNPQRPFREMETPLRLQTRTVRIFGAGDCFAMASIEGRCAIRYLEEAKDKGTGPDGKANAFAFRCHRETPAGAPANTSVAYSVNSIDCFPRPEAAAVFSTAGADGGWNFWDKDKRTRLKEVKAPIGAPAAAPTAAKVPITASRWNADGSLFATAYSYDWGRGAEGYNPAEQPRIQVTWVQPDMLKSKK